MKTVENHESVGKSKPLLYYSIIAPKALEGLPRVMGMNEWNWSNLVIWKEFLGVEHLFHKGFLREIIGKTIPFFHGKKHINMTAERGNMGSFIWKPGLSTPHYSTSFKMVCNVVSVWNKWNAISFISLYIIPKLSNFCSSSCEVTQNIFYDLSDTCLKMLIYFKDWH